MNEKKVREAIYCMKSFADDTVCEECDKAKTNEAQRRKQAESIRQRGIEQMAEHDPSATAKRQMNHKPYQAAVLIREQ